MDRLPDRWCLLTNVVVRLLWGYLTYLPFPFLKVDKRACPNDIFIPADKLKDGQSGQKALVRLVGWNDRDKNPNGEVIDVLGEVGDNNTEMNAILAEFGLPLRLSSGGNRLCQHPLG